MKTEAVQKVSHKVVRQFPEMEGIKPAVKSEKGSDDRFLMTYKGAFDLPDGNTMKRIVHVVASEEGDVIRMSTSR